MKNSFSLSKIVVFMLFSFVCTNFLFAQNGQKWSTGGNTGSASDFLGTTNAAALIFKTNNTEYFQIDANGNIIVKSFMGNYSGIVLSNTAGILNKLDFNGNAAQYLAGDGNFKDISATSGWLLDHNNLTTVQNCNVGIGVSHPTEKLDIDGNIKTTGIVYANGGLVVGTFKQGIAIVTTSLGVGTNNPTEQVDVMGNIKASGTVFANFINSPKIITNRITSTDTVIHIGDSSFVYSNSGPDNLRSSKLAMGFGIASFGHGIGSIGIGRYVDARGPNSYTLGTCVETSTNANFSIVMGSGFNLSNSTRLINDKPNSLMIGFNSTIPTLFVSPSPGPANNTTGNVGIGTTTPESKLDVRGNILCGGSDFVLGKYDGKYQGSRTGQRALVHDGWCYTNPDVNFDELVINYGGDFEDGVHINQPFGFPQNTAPSLIVDGRVGIGTGFRQNEKGYLLAVNGKIGAKEVEVETTSDAWSDFVFDKTFKLKSLDEVENYINLNKHLPDVPSGKEVEANGINLGKMDATLLQKIEELTLYVIDLKKENDNLKKRITSLENK